MRAVVQRVTSARVDVNGETVGAIQRGLVILVGISHTDTARQAAWMADKVVNLRIFADNDGKMNRSLVEVGGEALIVSQFTLYGDARKGRRPSFLHAAAGPQAERVYEQVVQAVESHGVRVETGRFGAMMDVSLTNEGPVTILLDSDETV